MLKFIFNAVFWTALVAAFTPQGFSAAPDGALARTLSEWVAEPAGTTIRETRTQAEALCLRETKACDVVNELARFTGFMAGAAVDRAERAYAERTAESEQAPATLDELLQDLPSERAAR